MNIRKVILENFRGFKTRTEIPIENDITAFIGKNDAGKSTIMEALDIFFNGTPESGDASVGSHDKIVRIACSFSDYPAKLVIDSSRETSLKSEYLLGADGFLTIECEFNCALAKPKQTGVYALAEHPSGKGVSDLLELKIDALKKRAKELDIDLADTNKSVSSALRHAIWAAHPSVCTLRRIPLDKEDGKKVYEAISEYFPVVSLFKSDRTSTDQDEEAQDPMSAAIRRIVAQKDNEFGKIKESVESALAEVANETVAAISKLSSGLASVLKPKVVTKKLESLFSVSLNGDDEIPINKRGSGVRRLILLGFFKAEVERKRREASNERRNIIYAIEEPETSQHPDNQKKLLEALRELAEEEDTQVLITTHTPVLAERLDEKSLRYVRQNPTLGKTEVLKVDDDAIRKEILDDLGVLPDNRIRIFIGVEGGNDINFLKAISRNLARLHPECYPDLGEEENKGTVVFIPMGGSSLQLWATRLNGIHRKQVYFMDRDNRPPAKPKYEQDFQRFKAAGHMAFMTDKKEMENYIPLSLLQQRYPGYAGTGDSFEDVPDLVARRRHVLHGAQSDWETLSAEDIKRKQSKAKAELNGEVATAINTEDLFDEGDPLREIRGWFGKLKEILDESR